MTIETGRYIFWLGPEWRFGFQTTGIHQWRFAIGRLRITKKRKT